MSVRGLTHSLLESLMLVEKLEPRVLDFWVLVRGLRTLPAEVSDPASVTDWARYLAAELQELLWVEKNGDTLPERLGKLA